MTHPSTGLDYCSAHGVTNPMKVTGLGPANPLNGNDKDLANRRVEITVVK